MDEADLAREARAREERANRLSRSRSNSPTSWNGRISSPKAKGQYDQDGEIAKKIAKRIPLYKVRARPETTVVEPLL